MAPAGLIAEDGYGQAVQRGIRLREAPLLDFPIRKSIHVRTYGAIAGNNKTDTRAIQEAIDDAVAGGVPTVIEFDKGLYRLDVSDGRTALRIDKASNLILDGRGCEFLILDPTKQFVAIRRSERIIVKNLSIDFEVLPHTQGWVTAVDREAGTLTVRLDPAYPDLDQPHFRQASYKWGFIKDKNDPVSFKEGTEFRIYLSEWSRVGTDSYRLKAELKSQLKTVEVGDPYVQISRVDGALLSASRSQDVTFADLRVYASPNAVLATEYCTRPNFIRVKAAPREGRWLTSGADGCFNFGGREGPWVEGCYFEALADDNLIIKGFPGYCINVVDPYTFDLVHAEGRFDWPQSDLEAYRRRDEDNKWMVQPGDTLTVMDPVERAIASRPVVLEVNDLTYGVRVRVDRKIPGLRAGTDYEKASSFFNDDACLSGFVVRNNVFKSAVRFGFLLKSHDGLVENNLFERHSDQSICALNTYQEFNNIPSNLLIRGNTFRLASGWPVRTAQTAQHKLNPNRNIFGVVQASVNWPVGQWDIEETGLREIRNLFIEDNRFVNWWQNPAVAVNNGLHVRIIGNTFELDETHAATALTGAPIAVKVVNSTDVLIENNILRGPRLNPTDGIRVIGSGNVINRNNKVD
ncbi:hypothetical protein D4R89_01580 [bacterium]|nr:MAG: hypothetical protein D4R89_01580 [bacterium]